VLTATCEHCHVSFKKLLDQDLRERVEAADALQRDARRTNEERRVGGETVRRADEMREVLANFELNLAEVGAHKEQARRQRVIHDDRYDRQVLAMEAAVMDCSTQLMELSPSDEPALRARLEQGLLAVRAERDRAIQEGWAYKGERRSLATREFQWGQALRQRPGALATAEHAAASCVAC
jgi:hypothetical protein